MNRSPTADNPKIPRGDGPPAHLPTLAQIEQAAIEDTIRACSGNRSWAARALGISRSTLYRRRAKGAARGARPKGR